MKVLAILACAFALAQGGSLRVDPTELPCTCNEAQQICDSHYGADDVLIAHAYCNKFYKCSNGQAVPHDCPSITLYDPINKICDWPQNVVCGERPIAEGQVDEDCILDGNDNNGSNDNGNVDGGNNEENGNDNNNESSCNCNPGEAPSICQVDGSDGILVAHENCNQFYKCDHGKPVAMWCYDGLVYNPYTEQCDWPANVECGDRPIVDIEDCDENETGNDQNGNDNGSGNNNNNENGNNPGTCNCNPGEAPSICQADGSDGTLIAHENCNQFYKCDNGNPVAMWCYAGLVYNPYTEQCDWPANVECGDRPIVEIEDCDEDETGNDQNGNDNGSGNDHNNENGNNPGTCNCNPGEAPSICQADGSDGTLIAHENCNQFYKCDHGKPVALWCYDGLVYNPYTEQCDWPVNVDCGGKPIAEKEDSDEDLPPANDQNGNDNNNNENGNNPGTCNCNPGEAPSICQADGSDGTLIAHENCNQFYKCDHGKPVAFWCYNGLVYNPYTEQCDWPANVDCGDKPIAENEDCDEDASGNDQNGNDNGSGGNDNNENGNNPGTCNCNPGEAPSICQADGSDGTLIAHENCNQFYKCDHGKPVAFWCYDGLVYNPYTEQCDWPVNVDCGGKPIAEKEDSDEDLPPANDQNGNDNNNNENGNNPGTCNCNPGEAPSICQADGSDGTLIAHENCNQFYKCDHGKPVAFWCYNGLVYNPYTEQCDWPANVDCGDKPIAENEDCDEDASGNDQNGNDNGSGGNDNNENGNNPGTCNCNPGEAPSICQADGSDGTLIAHENCNQFYKCDHGKPVAFWCYDGLVYNPYTEQCDWPVNVDCGGKPIAEKEDSDEDLPPANDQNGNDNNNNENGNNPGTCNCNPGEAPSICQADGSDGTLIAHENCNQFYKCDHGKPVAFWCYNGLVYNPYTEQCDWPANVDCGDKPIAENEDCDEDASGNDQNGNDNGSGGNDNNENGNNPGTCNCNPGEAPSICQADGSDGTLIAHENCNQFYKCDHGKPVAFWCYNGLVYNPYTEQCDWPANVDCAGKPIAEKEDSDEDLPPANDQNGNDNNNNENGNNPGTCNCNPGEAPSICQADGSDGTLIAHENCNQFYKCDHGKPVAFWCYNGLVYNPYTERCDWPANVDCGGKPIAEKEDSDEDLPPANDQNGNDNNNNENGNNPGTCNCNPGEAPSICQADGSDGTLIAHENCNQFYKCDHGKPVAFWCYNGLVYNPYTERCDWPANVDCGGKPIAEKEDSDEDLPPANDQNGNDNNNNENGNNPGTCNCNPGEAPSICQADGSDGTLIAHENCNQFYKCDHGKPVAFWCYNGLVYNPYTEQCDWPANVDCGDKPIAENEDCDEDASGNDQNGNDNGSGGNDNNENGNNPGTCNCNPGEAPSICQADGSDATLIAHENCNQFYKCDHGKPVAFWCYDGLVYNPYTEQCDWPANVDCGGKPIAENEDSDEDLPPANDQNGNDNNNNENGNNPGTCNCNPGEAPSICQADGSDGTLIAHENCNQFYKCDHGKPVAFWCYNGLVYNPYTEQCDWPANVNCGDKPIAENEDCDEDASGNDQNGNDNGSGGNDNNENGNNPGTCNCNPGEAPSICQADGSDGTLIAHENCNQFYKCDHGKPVAFWCYDGLVYNPYTEQCDWPVNVDCGGKPIAEKEDSDEDLPPANDQNGNDSNNNENGNNPGTCNCNPGEAPSICQADGSDGFLIAHENCNQFYKCDNGKPVAFWCFDGLVYNPYTEQCDWPANVECGDRPIVDIEDCDENETENDQNGNDNGSGGNDNSENGNNPGTCNCNPGEAPSICQADGSDGTLIAHENCNQFYKCDHGKPVAFWCNNGLVYNPYTEQCDWPANVNCGDKPIAENEDCDEDASGNDQNDSDNGSGGDNNNENDNTPGTCNCNPGEAPSICQADGSGGVLIAHENCNQFYKCDNGNPVAMWCYAGLVYNPYTEQCDWPANVECGDRPIVEIEDCDEDETGNCNGSGDINSNENGSNDHGNGNENSGAGNCDPSQAPTICESAGSNGVLVAHENCDQFYLCAGGIPVAISCNENLLFNPFTDQCDWPSNVDCGDRIVPGIDDNSNDPDDNLANDPDDNLANDPDDSGNNGNNCNCRPEEAPAICAADGSGGELIAHEECDKFYMCALGTPVVLVCSSNLLYNPYTKQCDWPFNVDCGDRVIPEAEENNDNNNGQNDSGNDSVDSDSNDNGNVNDDPSQAPLICGNSGSEGVLVAHPNCDQFYMCSGGLPVVLNCSDDLLFNPVIQRCDWPRDVDCGDRVVPESEDNSVCACNPRHAPVLCARAGSDGTLVAHENCNMFYMCAHGVPVSYNCAASLSYNIDKQVCDWPQNVDCGDRLTTYSFNKFNKEVRDAFRK